MATKASTTLLKGTKIISIPEKHFYAIGKEIHHGSMKEFRKNVKNLVKREGGIPPKLSQRERKAHQIVRTCMGDGRFVNVSF